MSDENESPPSRACAACGAVVSAPRSLWYDRPDITFSRDPSGQGISWSASFTLDDVPRGRKGHNAAHEAPAPRAHRNEAQRPLCAACFRALDPLRQEGDLSMDVTGAMVTYFLGTEQWPPPDAQEQLYAVAAAALRALREGQDPERPDFLFTLVQMLHGVQDREQDHARGRRRT